MLFCVGILATVGSASLFADEMSVTVRETQLRESPTFLGRVVSLLRYGDRLEIVEQQGPWYQGRNAAGQVGWVHSSALTTQRIVLQSAASETTTGASDTEVALAGRGFNQEVEERYKAEQGLDFGDVDRMEGYEYPPEALIAFLEEGGLSLPEGVEE